MTIHIPVSELHPDFRDTWKLSYIRDPHIDYATNCIHAWQDNKEVVLFQFKDYGFVNDNRFNSYEMNAGNVGITIRINKPEISDIVATFQRYDYTILYYAGEELYANELKSNYDHLMHYLKI
mgnify:CR=1 FL=1